MTDAALPPKRSLFKRPTWAQTTSVKTATSPLETTSSAINMFDRSESFNAVVAERERRKREKAGKKKGREEKRRSGSDVQLAGDESPEKRFGKRRRISGEDDEEEGRAARLSDQSGAGEVSPVVPMNEDSISQRYDDVTAVTKPVTRLSQRNTAAVISLDSGDDDDDNDDDLNDAPNLPVERLSEDMTPPRHTIPPPIKKSIEIPESDSESDLELAQIKRKARQRARLEEKAAQDRLNASETHSAYGSTYQNEYPTAPHDPKIQLFITSPIPNSTPLVVSIRLSQRLLEVKEAWFGRQHFPPSIDRSDIFFTYRLRKLYDVTTGKSLGIKVDSQGRIIPDEQNYLGDDETGVGGEHEGKVHLEAVTEELYLQMREQKRNARSGSSRLNHGSTEKSGGEGTPIEGGDSAAGAEPVIKITMKAKGYKDVKLKVKPVCFSTSQPHVISRQNTNTEVQSTQFSKIENAARRMFEKQSPIGEDQIIILSFDGEPLEPPEGQIKDTEIEDLDSIEVLIR